MVQELQGELRLQEPMANHTSWRVGGPAEQFYLPKNVDDLSFFLKSLSAKEPLFWCGLGSNTLVRDGGIKGVVIATQKYLNRIEILDDTIVRAEVGVSCATLARFTARQHLTGIEFLAGVPGTIGGALAMNAGCHGGETWPWLVAVEVIDRQGVCCLKPAHEFSYRYRHVDIPVGYAFVAAHFCLQHGDKEQSLQKIRDLLARRAATQPTNEPTGGSTFRNPPNDFAARLIEAAGLKGYQLGGALVSPKHANFIVSLPGCTALDIETLMAYLQQTVQAHQGVWLEAEVKIIGDKK
jgi:UDP-N-acetylmuramate dehydrogenase